MTEFSYEDLLPVGGDETPYRLLTTEGVSVVDGPGGRSFLQVEPEALRMLTETAMHDIAHYLRPAHLQQLANILDDPEASNNDKFVALDLLKNANIAAGGILPMCQDTGTAIVMGKRGQHVLTPGRDEEPISRGVYDAYTRLNLRYSQMAPVTMWDERNTGSNLPAQIELYADTTAGHETTYKFLFMAKGGGSANKSYLFQETKAILNPEAMLRFLDEKLRGLGTAACPPYHLAIVIGGTSAEFALKTAKYASAKYLDQLPKSGDAATGHGFRDTELEEKVLELTRQFGIGAQFGGKYFCHDVRVVRLPRHGASLPVAIAVSCSADRQVLGKITPEGVFIEQLETDPARFLPDQTHTGLGDQQADAVGASVHAERDPHGPGRGRLDRPQPPDGTDPRGALEAPGQDPALAQRPTGGRPGHRPREDQGAARRRRADARLPARPPGLLRRPGQDPRGDAVRLVRPDDRRPDGLLRRPVPGRRWLDGDARQGQPQPAGHRRVQAHGGFYLGSIGGPAARLAQDCIRSVEVLEYPELGMEAIWKIEVEDFPAFVVVDDKGNDFFASVTKPVAFTIEKRTGLL